MSKELLKELENTIQNIINFEDKIGGFYIKDSLYKELKKLEKIENNFNQFDLNEIKSIIDNANISLKEREDNQNKIEQNKNLYIEQVKNRAIEKGGFIVFKKPFDEDISFKVAKIPFLIWCLYEPYKYKNYEIIEQTLNKLIEEWGKVISVSGEKLPNDNEYHSEWIRSLGIQPEEFYDFIEKKENDWFNNLCLWYAEDFRNYIVYNNGEYKGFVDFVDFFSLNNFVNNNPKSLDYDFTLLSLYKNNSEFDDSIILSKSYNINEKTNFPIYFKALHENNNLEEIIKNKSVIVKNSDETVNEIAINLSDFTNSVIFTNNATKVAHLINISKDIELNVFYIQEDLLKENCIYKLEKNGEIFLIVDNENKNVNNIEIPLTNCEENFDNINISNKVKNIAKLYNLGFKHIPNGFLKIGEDKPNFSKKFYDSKKYQYINLIARSAGNTEGNSNATFSGLFHSELLTKNRENNDLIIDKIFNSFKKPYIEKYCKKVNVDIPKTAIFYQDFIKADESFVIKINEKNIYIESFVGGAENIVNGSNLTIKYNYNRGSNDDFGTLINLLIKKCEEVHTIFNKNLECEVIMKDFTFYFVQVI